MWSGNPNQVAIKPAPPGYILALHVAPGATNPGPIGLELALQSLEIAPNIGDYVLDRAYSNKRQSFVRPLHQMGKNVTMDYTITEINNPKFIKVGTNGQRLLNSTGTLLPPGLPEYRQIPPENAKPEKTSKWHVNRAPWRWTRNRKLDNGGGRRNPVEKTFSMIKDKGGLKAGWCRSFGLAAHTMGVLALAIAHNLKETIGIERTQTQKSAPPARPKSHQPTRRNISTDSLTPRAPPD